jgi:high affinity cAMP-specific and IBMX-insensitive 3',5'-cyclic phosphodiesterase 8
MNSDDDLALLYNDKAVLESHHSAFAFKLTIKNLDVNIFRNLDREVYRNVRANIVDMVLATEMSQHKLHVTNFVNALKTSANTLNGSQQNDESLMDLSLFRDNKENLTILKRLLIKCADVSNPARPLKISIQWTKRISEEFFRQTEEEIARGLPISLPTYNRSTCSIPSSQIGFYNFFITDLYTVWHGKGEIREEGKVYK